MTVSKPKLVGGQIQGSFRLDRDLNGILSKGIGGACLIGDFARLLTVTDATTKGVVTTACTDKSQCNPNLPRGWARNRVLRSLTKLEHRVRQCRLRVRPVQTGDGNEGCWPTPWPLG